MIVLLGIAEECSKFTSEDGSDSRSGENVSSKLAGEDIV